MKPRMQKLFITLLSIFTVGLTFTNAYTFEVLNRSPFGTLNLQSLFLKPSTSMT